MYSPHLLRRIISVIGHPVPWYENYWRDIKELIKFNILMPDIGGGRSTSYSLVQNSDGKSRLSPPVNSRVCRDANPFLYQLVPCD